MLQLNIKHPTFKEGNVYNHLNEVATGKYLIKLDAQQNLSCNVAVL